MGNILSSLLKNFLTTSECKAFWDAFPKNIGKVSLPFLVLDGIGLTCGSKSWKVAVNLAANIGLFAGTYIINNNVGFMTTLAKVVPRLFTQDPVLNLSMLEYLVANAVLFLMTASQSDHFYEADNTADAVINCISNPIQCVIDGIEYLATGIPASCKKDNDYDTGLCYPKCKLSYHGVGPVCWGDNPPDSEGWEYDGVKHASAFIHHPSNYDRETTGLIDKPTPSGCHRTAACTVQCDGDGNIRTTDDPKIFARELGADLTDLYWPGYRRGLDSGLSPTGSYVTRGGTFTNCNLFGQTCPEGYSREGAICYKDPKPGYNCDLLRCYKNCPSGWVSSGIGCMIDSYGRGVGTTPSECPKGYDYDGVSICYKSSKGGGNDGGSGTKTSWGTVAIIGGATVGGVAALALLLK